MDGRTLQRPVIYYREERRATREEEEEEKRRREKAHDDRSNNFAKAPPHTPTHTRRTTHMIFSMQRLNLDLEKASAFIVIRFICT